MPHTVHTLDGQAHTYPDCTAYLADNGALRMHEGCDTNVYGDVELGPLIASYPAGQWTHYRVEPAPYEANRQANEDTGNAEDAEDETRHARLLADIAAQSAWVKEYEAFIASGRKAAEAQ